jgi:EmrB/QacA subfamily drug resistance transporter
MQTQSQPIAPASAPAASTGRPGVILAVLSVAAFMASLDVFIVNVAFPDIGSDFHGASLSNLSWILNGYAIVYAAMLVPLGRLADRYGRKAGFIGGLALFTAASAACAFSTGLWMLVVFRVLQAVGAAALTPTSLGLLLTSTPPERRVRAVRIWAASGALAAAIGPVVGGVLVQASWRWVFIVNVPVGVVAAIAAVRQIADSRDNSVTRTPDLVGAGLLALAIGSVSLGLVKGATWGWGSTPTVTSFVVAALGVAGFWLRSQQHPLPIVEPALLRVHAFAWSNVTSLFFSVAFGAGLLGVILWTQEVWGYSALRTGLAIAPGPVMVPLFVALNHRFANRVRPGRVAAAGNVLFATGNVLLLTSVGARPHYARELLPGWLLMGIGVGLALPTILSAATADLPPGRAATGSAVINMSRQIGTVLGVSVLVAVIGSHATYGATHAAFQHAWWIIVGASLVAAASSFGMTPSGAAGRVARRPLRTLLAFADRR